MTENNLVIIIDDDEVSNFIGMNMIQRSEMSGDVKTFQNAEDALQYIKEAIDNNLQIPKLIFLDINMPVMNGWDFLDEYRKTAQKKNLKIPIIILTSSVYQLDMEKARQYNEVDDFASKPLTIEVLNELDSKYFK